MQSGGDVALDTELGLGPRVRLYLPAVPEGAEVQPSSNDKPREERALVVEDDQLVLEAASELFQAMGYAVLSARDGAEALRLLQREPDIDVLFSDVMMPNGMSGLDLAHAVRERYPAVKIILASGDPLPALKSEQQDLSEFAFVSKPYRLADVARHLRT